MECVWVWVHIKKEEGKNTVGTEVSERRERKNMQMYTHAEIHAKRGKMVESIFEIK